MRKGRVHFPVHVKNMCALEILKKIHDLLALSATFLTETGVLLLVGLVATDVRAVRDQRLGHGDRPSVSPATAFALPI